MPGGASLLRQFGLDAGNSADRSEAEARRRFSSSVAGGDEGVLLPKGSRRRLSVADKDVPRWLPAGGSDTSSTKVDIAEGVRASRSVTSLIEAPKKECLTKTDDDSPRRATHLPHLSPSMFLQSRNQYAHLKQSPSVDSTDGGSRTKLPPNIGTAIHDSGVAAASVAASTRISSARQRMRSARLQPNTVNLSNEELGDQPSSHPHHPHSPPSTTSVPKNSPERKSNAIPTGNLLKVPELVNSLPSISTAHDFASSPRKENSKEKRKHDRSLFRPSTASTSSGMSKKGPTPSGGSRQGTFDQANGAGVFLNDGQRRVDFILVYQSGHSMTMERQRRYFEKNLQQEGLVLELDPLDGNEEVGKLCFVKVHAPWTTLCRSAEMLQMKMPLRNAEFPEDAASFVASRGSIFELIFDAICARWFKFNDTEKLLIGRQPNFVTAQFTRARIEQFLINDTETFFTPTQRIRVVYDIMQRAKCDPDNSKKRGLQWLLRNGVYLAAYPPHDGGTETRHLKTGEPEKWSQRQVLKHVWANFNRVFKPQPLNLVRTYFGEKVGFYFAWLGFYTQMLVFPSIVGVFCFLYGVFSLPSNPVIIELCSPEASNYTMCPVCMLPYCRPWTLNDSCEGASWNYRFDHESHVFMAVFTLIWATLFMELWKRKEAELACEWDAYDAEQEEEGMRPEYEARTQVIRVSPVTNEEEPYIPAYKRVFWSLQSLSGLFMLIMCVVAALVALITVRILLYGWFGDLGGLWKRYQFELASLVIHVLTFGTVMTLGWVYEKAAHRLTELECPRTQADYLSSYIWKVFIFEILNNFAPVVYAALIRGRSGLPHHQTLLLEMCDPGGCLNEVVQAIAILLLARLLISNAAELGVPFLKSVLKTMRLGAAVNPEHDDEPTVLRNLPRWQKDYTLNETNLDGVYAEYLEMMVQFGYVTLFVSAFPLAPLICLLNNIAEIRIDATNFVTSFRRPLPSRVSGIRIWRRCLNILIKLSVLCNGAFLAFTSELIPKLVYRFWYSPDGSTYGYVGWTLAKVNVSGWDDYYKYSIDNHSTECYFRDFRQSSDSDYGPTLIWWQVMVARLAFFIVFVIAFYFVQWLCDFLVPDVPQHVKLRVDRANFLAKQALYGQEMRGAGGFGSCAPTPAPKPHARYANGGAAKILNGPWTTMASGFADYQQSPKPSLARSRPSSPSPLRLQTLANGDLMKNHQNQSIANRRASNSGLASTRETISNGYLANVNGFTSGSASKREKSTDNHRRGRRIPNLPSSRQNTLDMDESNTPETTYV